MLRLVAPVGVEYHVTVPALAVAPIVTGPASQREFEVVVNIVGVDPLIVAITDVLDNVVQLPLVAST